MANLALSAAVVAFIVFLQCGSVTAPAAGHYTPDWESLDKRPLPQWYDDAKFGIFLHWGVFSVPSYVGAWFWEWWKGPNPRDAITAFMKQNYPPDFTYADFAPQFTAEFFNPREWAQIFKASGARYVVLTTKHHEGYCLWPSKYSWNWNSMDVGPKRDLVGELSSAIRNETTLKFGTYHSLFEFFNPLYLQDKANNFTTNSFVAGKTMPELFELVNKYKPDIIWSDGQWEAKSTYWNATHFLAWLYNDSPVKDTVVVNDRWGRDTVCKHGGYLTCRDHFNPKTLQKRKFEDSTTVYKAGWCYRRNASLNDVHDITQLITTLVQVVSCGGNLLLNVGPTKCGTIAPIFEERLRQMGQWLAVNGEAIYATRPWLFQNDSSESHVWYTSKKTSSGVSVYAIMLKWPRSAHIRLDCPQPTWQTRVTLLGYTEPVAWSKEEVGGLRIHLPVITFSQMPCQWAWVFRLDYLFNAF
ncbi:alpha-L-fucosidase-like [Babylonia areolata]|uniref:alpha-L-fucosidase-like n=1 Tax=Babylonia areolata TaxID=304850 RepID=UPI003FD0BC91